MIAMIAIIVLGIVFAALRLLGWKSQAFQAFAHIFVGLLIAAWFYLPDSIHRGVVGWTLISISAVELFQFIKDRSKPIVEPRRL